MEFLQNPPISGSKNLFSIYHEDLYQYTGKMCLFNSCCNRHLYPVTHNPVTQKYIVIIGRTHS